MGEHRSELPTYAAVTGSDEERIDVFGGWRFLQPANHRGLPAMLGGLKNRQCPALRPIAKKKDDPEQFRPIDASMQAECACRGRFDIRSLSLQLVVSVQDILRHALRCGFRCRRGFEKRPALEPLGL